MLAYNEEQGYQLLHSLPRFPRLNDEGEILDSLSSNIGFYAQFFFCMSISKYEAEKMKDIVNEIKPHYYANYGWDNKKLSPVKKVKIFSL